MRYRTKFQYTDTIYDYDGDYDVIREATKYTKSYSEHEDFLQTLDMAGDENTLIIEDKAISDTASDIFYALAYIVYLMQGYRIKAGQKLFYYLMDKALIRTINNELCIRFDNKGVYDEI